MNRVIKFRAWNEKTSKMLDLTSITPLSLNTDIDGLFLPFDDVLVLMQFTGLTDKNGVDIYEGDVFKWEFAPSHEEKVTFLEGCFGFLNEYDGGYSEFVNINKDRAESMVVIGNIYENPELLNGNNTDRGGLNE